MTLLTATGLAKHYGPHVVLEGLDVSVAQDERVGLVGQNGCGKSTLARILAGEETADAGTLAVRRDAKVLYLAQKPMLTPGLSIMETVLRGRSAWWEAKTRYDRVNRDLAGGAASEQALAEQAEAAGALERLGGFDISHEASAILSALNVPDPERPVDALSGGEQRRVALSRLLLARPELAILDEPTNHLDLQAVEWLESYLADQYRGAVLLITHDRYFLDAVVDRTLEIERGKLFSYQGGFADYLSGKAERLALAERTEQNRQNFLRRELDWLSRSPPARTTKQRARIKRAEQAVLARPDAKAKKLELSLQESRAGKSIVDLEDVRIVTPEAEGRSAQVLIDGLELHLTQGERVGIVGKNGAGKSTLLRAVVGEHPVDRGQIKLGKNARIAYLDQHRTGLDEDASIFDNVTEGRSHVRLGERDVHAMTYLERFLFSGAEVRKPVKALSGGERTRVSLARLLKQNTSLLLLDEPTNDLDLDTLSAVEGLLLEHGVTALVVTHDRWFLDRIATSILWFEGDGQVTLYAGNYSAAREQQQKARALRSTQAQERASAPVLPKPSKPKTKPGLSYKETKELAALEGQIEALDARVSELDGLLSDPEVYQNRAGDVAGLVAERDEAKAASERALERWSELEEKREASASGPLK